MNDTIAYYDKNAEQYYDSTIGVSFSDAYRRFLEHVPEGGSILDVGCGSGRDTEEFRNRGYKAVGLDASGALAEIARRRSGVEVIVADMSSWIAPAPFDGIWCCASLLHLQDEEIRSFFYNLPCNLAVNGSIFLSVKTGIETGYDEKGRYMRNFTLDEIWKLCESAGIEIVDYWETSDGLGREGLKWINVVGVSRRYRD